MSDRNDKKVCLDLGFLIKDDTSCLKGSLDSEADVDFYNFTIPYNRTFQNYFNIEIQMEMPAGSNYNLTLYDEYGNQVGTAQFNGGNQKNISIPNWDTKTSKYCIKVENGDGSPVNAEDSYKIRFHISQNEEAEKTDAIREAYIKCNDEYVKKKESYEESLAEYNHLLQEAEANYSKELESLHKKQYESLSPEKQYKGEKTLDNLLVELSEGHTLDAAEMEYVKIYANLADIEKAQKQSTMKKEFSQKFRKDLEGIGISPAELENMKINIQSNGIVNVEGVDDLQKAEAIEKLVTEKYAEQLYRHYIGIADSVRNLPVNVYQFATDMQEIERFLETATNGKVSSEDLYVTQDGKIGGLPDRVSSYVNETKDNVKAIEIFEKMQNVISYQKVYGKRNAPEFTSSFQFQNGELSVTDNGFMIDIADLSAKMNSIVSGKSMYGNTYEYSFKKVL